MADTLTVHYSLIKPEPGAANATWGISQNAAFDIIDATLYWIVTNFSAAAPLTDGVANAGAAYTFARSDHIHPSDTSRAPVVSPTFTGTPIGTTPAVDDNTTKLATTAYFINQGSSASPAMNGVAAAGSSKKWSHDDHVHPVDTSRYAASNPSGFQTSANVTSAITASFASPVFTGTPSIDGVAGGSRALKGTTSSTTRWTMELGNAVAESGGNAGSDFGLTAYTDGGGVLSNPLYITRSNAAITTAGRITAGTGYTPRNGSGGSPGGNLFNIYWSGAVASLFIDTIQQGNFAYTSDYRIKKNVATLGSTWNRVLALRPVSYSHKDYTPPSMLAKKALKASDKATGKSVKDDGDASSTPLFVGDDTERWGFVAHELQDTLIQDAATGVKNQDDCIQSPNPWTVIAALTSALQEAMGRIEKLEAKAPK